jgi:hypothetical protein
MCKKLIMNYEYKKDCLIFFYVKFLKFRELLIRELV